MRALSSRYELEVYGLGPLRAMAHESQGSKTDRKAWIRERCEAAQVEGGLVLGEDYQHFWELDLYRSDNRDPLYRAQGRRR